MQDDEPLRGGINRDRDLACRSLQRQYGPQTGVEAGGRGRLVRIIRKEDERRSQLEPGIERFFEPAPPCQQHDVRLHFTDYLLPGEKVTGGSTVIARWR